jgi:hypothetical protein
MKTEEKTGKNNKKLINHPGYQEVSGGKKSMSKTDLECLTALQHDHLYMQQNYEKLRKKYIDEFVAIRNKKIIAAHKDLDSLLRLLRSKKINPACTLIEFFPPKDLFLVL